MLDEKKKIQKPNSYKQERNYWVGGGGGGAPIDGPFLGEKKQKEEWLF